MITIRLATTEDIDAVCRIEDACFDKPWSHLLIERDIAENPNAIYWLAVDDFRPEDASSGFTSDSGPASVLDTALATDPASAPKSPSVGSPDPLVVGFVGTHDIVGEINITNVAVDPAYRQQGIGTMLIAAMTQHFDDLRNSVTISDANDSANEGSDTSISRHTDSAAKSVTCSSVAKSTEIKNSGAKNAGAEIIGITLEVRVSNAPAIKLYENFGFKEEGRRKGYYSDGEDALIMWRTKSR